MIFYFSYLFTMVQSAVVCSLVCSGL